MENNHLAESFLHAATRIGNQLCETTFWDNKRHLCNWMGRQDITDPVLARFSSRCAALGPDLFGGSTGIALFLNELYRYTKKPVYAEIAVAAFRRGLYYLKSNSVPVSPLSFFGGHLGLVYLGCRLSDLNLDYGLAEDIQWLTDEVIQGATKPHTLDIISGNAGAIPVLLQLSRRSGFEKLEELAVILGNEICDAAQWDKHMCMWQTTKASGEFFKNPPMTGFSHGASGFSFSLLQLFAHTGNQKFLKFARGGFAFEDSLFSEPDGNWIDTRSQYSSQNGRLTGIFQTAWCHGAPGIALARIGAVKIDPDYAEDYRKAAAVGIQTTISTLQRNMEIRDFNATFCHGLCGLSEIILIYSQFSESNSETSLSAQTAMKLVQRYSESGNWPSGVNAGGPNPCLMFGMAGIGYHLLRLYDSKTIPSILTLLT